MSSRRTCSTALMVSTNSRQSMAPSKRRLAMLLLTETWSAAWRWFSASTNCLMVAPVSERRCSIQVRGKASAGPCPCNRRASSATNELINGGSDRAMSAITRIRLLGSFSAVAVDPVAGDARRDPAEILHQRQTEHDGQSPKFTKLQRGDRLVGRDETT